MCITTACGSADVDPAAVNSTTNGEDTATDESSGAPHDDGDVADLDESEIAGAAASSVLTPFTLSGFLPGANVAGAEFVGGGIPGTYGYDYSYPKHSDIDYFVSKGLKLFRIPFRWARLQLQLGQALDPTELGRLNDIVNYAISKGATVVLDPHDYARRGGKVIGSGVAGAPTTQQFADFWSRLAKVYASNSHVIFGIMNEPNGMTTELWLQDANAAIAAIRAAGAPNVIFVPGNGYTGAHSWNSSWYGTPNGQVMLGVQDPLNNFVYEVHQYLDDDSSGTKPDCKAAPVGSTRLKGFTQWLRDHNARGYLGEFGVSQTATCLTALEEMLDYVDANRDVWVGWTYWAGGSRWNQDYMFSIQPVKDTGAERPQINVLINHL